MGTAGKRSGKYLTIPDNRFPGRRPVRFFMSRLDVNRVLTEVLKVNPSLAAENISPVSVKLLQALRSIAVDKTPGMQTVLSFIRRTKCMTSCVIGSRDLTLGAADAYQRR